MKTLILLSCLGSLLLLTLLPSGARADDTEIFFNQTNANVGANVMLILDTSGSMDDEVTSRNSNTCGRTMACAKRDPATV